ncbi:MAG: SIMPL domain-containing protein [Christensenella sp.]|nr:SIMPL domain-containing protein [Christensenella sp.]
MTRTITVKGVGSATAKPDYVIISMTLDAQDMKYEKAMELAAVHLEQLKASLAGTGFDKEALKTTNFNVRTDYQNEQDGNGTWKNVFNGYIVSHSLKIAFDFDAKRLPQTLGAIADCVAKPVLSIAFTVKDPTGVKEELLKSAAENARRTAEILCEASNEKLGRLVAIDYNWAELNICSETRYSMADNCLAAPMRAKSIEIEPDEIDTRDTVTFVWELA